jgi:hypothetical protein
MCPHRLDSSRVLINGEGLKQSIQLPLLSPAAVEIVKVNAVGLGVADNRISPVRQLDAVAGRFRTEQFRRPMDGPLQLQPITAKRQHLGISDLRSNRDDV